MPIIKAVYADYSQQLLGPSFTKMSLCFLPHDAMQSAVMPQYVVCPSVMLRYVFHRGWNTSKLESNFTAI